MMMLMMMIMKKTKLDEEPEIDNVNTWLDLFVNDASLNITTPLLSPDEYVIRNTKLEQCLLEYFSSVVPTLLEEININGFLRFNTHVGEFRQKICAKLEAFICGGVTEDGIKGLAATYSKPQKYCGKVFNVGDLTYSCKTCAQDPTCVFCHFCFHQSIHKNHRYKLHTSNGTGGYCDCGDEEAWTAGPACDYHKEGMDNDESWNPFISLPTDIQCRAAFIFKFVLQYCMELLMEEHDDDTEISLPIDISKQVSSTSHIVMLYNDESHSYEEVINTLMESIKCTRQQAFQFAAVVDKEGRSSIYNGQAEDCTRVVEDCTRLTQKNGKGPLKCKSMSRNVVAHQIIALDLMSWVTEMIDLSDGLRRLLCLLTVLKISGVHREWSMSFLETIIRHDTSLWKVARARSHQLFMNNILLDMYGRKEFAITFAKCYKLLIEDFIVDDHDHDISVAALSVQIFTVPSLATMLILDSNILKTCLEVFLEKLQPAKGKAGNLDFQESVNGVNIPRANFIVNDVLYLLRQKPDWTLTQFSTNFLDAFDVFVDILKLMQGMDPVVRKTQTHIAYEPNWETAFNLQLGIMPVIRLMMSWCCSDVNILKAAAHRCVFALKTIQPLKYTTVKNRIVVNHDVTTKSTSLHFALSRFLAGLLCGSSKFGLSLLDLLQMESNPDESMIKLQLQILEYPLRSLVLSAQVNAQMWKRNGYAIQHQVFCYHNVRFVCEMSDRDVLILQILASIMDHDHFVKALLHKYNLRNWSKGKNADDKDNDKEAAEKESVIAREFLLLIFHVLCERYVAGVSAVTTTQILEREIIHRLCLGPMSRSTLMKNLPFRDADEEDDNPFESMIDDILKEVALYREPGVTGKGVFELKEDSMTRCNQYFIHFTKSEQAKMVEEKRRIGKKNATVRSSYLHPPPHFQKNFQNIVKLVCCDRLLKVIRNVLMRAIKGDHGSEEQVEVVLMIIALGLMEARRFREEQNLNFLADFNFLHHLTKEKGSKKSILNLLDELLSGNDSKEYHAMGKWVKQLLQVEIEHSGVATMDVDTDHVEPESTTRGDEHTEKAEKARISAEQKRKMMEQINKMQKAFIQSNSKLFDITDVDDDDFEENTDQIMEEDSPLHPVAIGGRHSTVSDNDHPSVLCILCQEEERIDGENFFVVTSFVHKSRLMKPTNAKQRDNLLPELSHSNTVNVSSCGHVVHIQCWEKYYNSVKEGESLFQRRPRSSIDVMQAEYLCPLCKSLCNCVLPLLPRVAFNQSGDSSQDMSLNEFLTYLERFSVEMCTKNDQDAAAANSATPAAAATPPQPPQPPQPDTSSWAAVFTTLSASYSPVQIVRAHSSASSENFMEMFAKRLLKVFSTEFEKRPVSYSVPYLWMACSFTMQSYECSTRMEGTNIFQTFSERQDKFWHALVQYLANYCVMEVYEPIQKFGNVLFNFFCGADCNGGLSILEADIFGMLVSLRFLMCCIQNIFQEEEPKLMNTSTWLIDDVVFKICLVANLVKIYLTAPVFIKNDDSIDDSIDDDDGVDDGVVNSWLYIQGLVNINHTGRVDGQKLKQHILESLLPFMRCSAIFFHYITGVKLPDNLGLFVTDDIINEEMKTLQMYLNLPDDTNEMLSLETLTSDPLVNQMIERWCKHKDVTNRKEAIIPYCYVQPRKLIDLPKDYSSLINRVSGFMCPTLVNDSSRVPALCLVCDTILCSQCYCCVSEEAPSSRRYGTCSKHTMECGAGIGVFLRIRDCEIVLMHNHSKGLFLPSPYLDEYGETDRGLCRGNPLYLNEGRYRNLQQLWLRQRIPEAIAQAMESKQSPILPSAAVVTNWHQL